MAVQAQYPSNALLFNRNVQEQQNDYSLQQNPGGYIDQQSHILFNNGATNISRKRGREISNDASQLVDLALLHNPNYQHQNVVSTGLKLAFTDHQLHQNKKQSNFSLLNEEFENQFKQERQEIDRLIQTQGEYLRRTLADKRQKHCRALLTAAEESVVPRLREKEAEVERATRRKNELESRAAQLSIEAHVWQAKIRTQEATAAALQSQLQHALMSVKCAHEYRKNHMLTCASDGGAGDADDAESANIDPTRTGSVTGPVCKSCWTRGATVVILPCRHLCVCIECDNSGLQACPACLTVKSASVEALFS